MCSDAFNAENRPGKSSRHCEVSGIPVGARHDVRLNSGEKELGAHHAGTLPLGRREVNHHFRPQRGQVRLRDRLTGRDILLEISPSYPCLTVWSLPGEPFVCVEPVSARRGAFETREDLVRLPPGETWKGWLRLRLG